MPSLYEVKNKFSGDLRQPFLSLENVFGARTNQVWFNDHIYILSVNIEGYIIEDYSLISQFKRRPGQFLKFNIIIVITAIESE